MLTPNVTRLRSARSRPAVALLAALVGITLIPIVSASAATAATPSSTRMFIDHSPWVGDPPADAASTVLRFRAANARPRHRLGEALVEALSGPAGIRIMA
jgi:hypothetical protein